MCERDSRGTRVEATRLQVESTIVGPWMGEPSRLPPDSGERRNTGSIRPGGCRVYIPFSDNWESKLRREFRAADLIITD